jgi:hypothetical protein
MPGLLRETSPGDVKPEEPASGASTMFSDGSRSSSSLGVSEPSPTKSSWKQKRDLQLHGNEMAHTSFDMDVLWTCCELLDIADVVDCDFISTALEAMSLLHRCEYTVDQTLASLALVVKYAKDGRLRRALEEEQTSQRGQLEFCMHFFLAHVYLVDEPCFLATWYKNVFKGICTIEDLNCTMMALFKERDFRLDVDDSCFDKAYSALETALTYTPSGMAVARAIALDVEGVPCCVNGDYY